MNFLLNCIYETIIYIIANIAAAKPVNDDILHYEVYNNLSTAANYCNVGNIDFHNNRYKVYQLIDKFNPEDNDNLYILAESTPAINRIYPKIYNNYTTAKRRQEVLNFCKSSVEISRTYKIYILKEK